jgi:uncharacterized protein YjiS (DUF1127 family)
MTVLIRPLPSTLARRPAHGIAARLAAFARLLEAWSQRSRERRMLATMEDRDLRDFGLSRYDAVIEWNKPFWRS